MQPVAPYQGKSDELEVTIGFLRMSIWLIYVVVELLFVDLSDPARYWRRLGPGRVAYQPSEETIRWQESFLRGSMSQSVEGQDK